MPVTIFMNMSADGYIAKNDDDVPFIANEEWDLYLDVVGEADALVVGRKTYEIMLQAGDFEELSNPETVVVTNNIDLKSDNEKISFTDKKPDQIIKDLINKTNIFICGGAELNSAFIKDKCIDEIKICISPYLLGQGISFLNEASCEMALKLENTQEIANGAILLTYTIKK